MLTRTDAIVGFSAEDALKLAKRCSPTVTQIGSAGRVWQVVREATKAGEATVVAVVELSRDDRPEVPDQFRAVHRH